MVAKVFLAENQGNRYLISCYTNTSKEVVMKNKDMHNDESESIIRIKD